MIITMKHSTVDPSEIEKFSRIADEWWDPRGKFKPLHDLNPARIEWIRDRAHPSGKTLLDIGCGGGLVCEPMARLGAKVTGIDASEKNIKVASLHAEQSGLDIDYRCTAAEELLDSGAQFDVVLALEIVEHVADVPAFIAACAGLVKPGGLLIMSTLNRTVKSYAMAIIGAEYVLRLLPRGTHDWNKFLKPHELHRHMSNSGIEVREMTGLVLNPLAWKWETNPKDLDVNYMLMGCKK